MRNNPAFVPTINELLGKLSAEGTAEVAVALANEVVRILGVSEIRSVDEVMESSLNLPNAERYDHWFHPHPIFKSDRAAFEILDANEAPIQAKLFWLKKRSRQFVAGAVNFTENWEDSDYTHNERFKVGIDFFFTPNGKSLQVVLANRGNVRLVELNGKLNNTQVDIFMKWQGVASLSSQEAIHTTLWESFKLKTVNEKFYTEIANNFTLLTQHLKAIGKDEEESKLFANRLLGRLLFCWFLRKKGIIDESMGYFNAKGVNATDYYRQSLERLFFLTLNTPIDERDVLQKQHQKQLFPELFEKPQTSLFKTDDKTPYLNGGLFEPHDNDYFQDKSLTFPEGFFVALYDHFDQFNFTTDESSPEYEQIAIDPEMLGRVFESLLASQIDETGQQARKAKGAFYTPREIVSYMCRESLRNYLYTKTNDDESIKSAIDGLLDISDSDWAKSSSNARRDTVKNYRTQIIEALDTVTILDPACGSGAFPMGMVQLLTKTYERLEGRFDPHRTKLQIIQNNIFGVDIEPMAVEIARLRAWLSLIVDEEDARSVEPLPNLDFKFVCANSLIPLAQGDALNLWQDDDHDQKLATIRSKYFNARTKASKEKLRKEYESLTKQTNLNQSKRIHQLNSFNPFKNNQPAQFFDPEFMFGLGDGFNIVIGNPPYVDSETMVRSSKDFRKTLSDIYETATGNWDLYIPFIELGYKQLAPSGALIYITPNKWLSVDYGLSLRKYIAKGIQILTNLDEATVFDAGNNPTIFLVTKNIGINDLRIDLMNKDYFISDAVHFSKENLDTGNYEILMSRNIALIEKLQAAPHKIHDYFKIENPFSVSEAYSIKPFIHELKDGQDYFKFCNTGTIVPFGNKWGHKVTRYLKSDFNQPILLKDEFKQEFPKRFEQSRNPKIIFKGMRHFDSFYDQFGEFVAGKSTLIATPISSSVDVYAYLGVLNSSLIKWYIRELYSSQGIDGGINFTTNIVKSLPIFEDPGILNEIARIGASLSLKKSNDFQKDIRDINNLVFSLYSLSPEEIAVIEDGQ